MNTKRFLIYLSLAIALFFYLSCSSKQLTKIPLQPPLPPPPIDITPKDSDGDGIADNDDKCPYVTGVSRYKGCPIPDTDNDGVSDELDKCPSIPGSTSNNGCPSINANGDPVVKDVDGDGIPDNKDAYPNVKGNKTNGFVEGKVIELGSIIESKGTSVVENKKDTAKKTASLGYSYYPKIKQNETKDFRVFVKINGEGKIIYQAIRNIEEIEGPDDYNTDTSKIVILPYNIDFYKKLKILLEVDSADFKIVPQTPEEQELDLTNGNHWHWNLRAVANSERIAQITMKIVAIKPEGDTVYFPSKQVNIKIAINKPDPVALSLWAKILEWAGNNIQYVVGSLLTPFGVFLYGKRKKKKDEIQAAKTNEKTV